VIELVNPNDARTVRALARGVRVHCGTDPPGETTLDPLLDDSFPDYDTEPVGAFSAT
jgi:hypothetical protein